MPIFLTGWAGGLRTVPFTVWGPAGTREMMNHIQEAFAFDIHVRRDVDERLPAAGIEVVSHDIEQGVVLDDQGLEVRAFLVDHGPVSPAFGYRVDYRGHSVVLSGDTRVSENLVRFAAGADVLVHEVVDPDLIRGRGRSTGEAIIAHHTTPEQAGQLFARIKPRLAVYSHAHNTENVMARTRTTYAGPLQGPEDMLTIEIGERIDIRHVER